MPPKKNPSGSSDQPDGSDASDPIADATSAIFDTEESTRDSGNADSRSSENAKTRNSTISEIQTSTGDDSGASTSGTGDDDDASTRQERIPGPYVPAEIAYALQEAQVQLRRITGEKISQSMIIQCALEICLRDFDDRKDESGLAQLVAKRYQERHQ